MLQILALIGLGVIVWKLSKMLNKAGDAVVKFSDNMNDYLIKSEHTKLFDPQENKKLAKKIEGIKGEESDEMYNQRVQEEINRLTE